MLNKLRITGVLVVLMTLPLALSIAVPSYAKGGSSSKGGGQVAAQGTTQGTILEKGAAQRTTQVTKPPGLAKKHKTPSGLKKQGKTPAGWSKGQKKGWKKQIKK